MCPGLRIRYALTWSPLLPPACLSCDLQLRNKIPDGYYAGLTMKIFCVGLMCTFLTTVAFGQLTARNPVDELKEQVAEALADARVPFSADQDKQLALLIEEERQA